MPAVDFKFCPVCSAKLVPNNEQVPTCPQGHWTAWNNVSATAGTLPIRDGQVLIGRRGVEPFIGAHCPVGGFMKPGETAEVAALRETLEETGLQCRITDYMGTYPDDYEGKATLNIYFRAEVVSGTMRAQDDVSELAWYPILELPDDIWSFGFANDRAVLRDLQAWYRTQN